MQIAKGVIAVLFGVDAFLLSVAGWAQEAELRVQPRAVSLDSPEATQQVLVSDRPASKGARGRAPANDLTRDVVYEMADPEIAAVDGRGRVYPLGDGKTTLLIRRQGDANPQRLSVTVSGYTDPQPVSFLQQVIPIFTKSGCNSGGCHGKAEGQNGFKLSVFGFDPAADYEALVRDSRGRRLFLAAPHRSLMLLKGSAEVPHGGGLKIEPDSLWYRRLARWISEGAPYESESVREVVSIEVEPKSVLLAPRSRQQLQVTAIDAAGGRRCVTVEAEYDSNSPPIAEVDESGLIESSDVPGEAAILVRYMGQVGVCRVTLPQPGVEFARPPENNFIDQLVWNKLERLGIAPSELADDGTFLRRVFLDTIGTLPTPAEARAFLSSTASDKRRQLIADLLERDEYADYWAMRWADILKVDKDKITPQGAVAMTRWLRRQFRENTPHDGFVRAILTAKGNTVSESPAAFFQAVDKPDVLGRSVSQLFLGVRIECAQCHQHPFEKWGQRDYFAFAGFFTGVKRKGVPTGGLAIFSRGGDDLKHPRTQETVPAAALGAAPADFGRYGDRREALADWMTSPDNLMLARSIVNRLWAHYFGRGLVEPVDDIRPTNPASNESLFEALAAHSIDLEYDLKAFTRRLLNSRVYQLSSTPNETNVRDEQNFSHAIYRAFPAEVLLDAISQATDVPENFNGWPIGYRAVQIWDNRMPSYFFRIFGRPARVSVCECERNNEPSISQALHLMNSPEVMEKIRHRQGRVRRLIESGLSDRDVIVELYLASLARFPSPAEHDLMRQAFIELADDRAAAAEDVLWTLLNTKEFLFNH